jgi:hypothetical protein
MASPFRLPADGPFAVLSTRQARRQAKRVFARAAEQVAHQCANMTAAQWQANLDELEAAGLFAMADRLKADKHKARTVRGAHQHLLELYEAGLLRPVFKDGALVALQPYLPSQGRVASEQWRIPVPDGAGSLAETEELSA